MVGIALVGTLVAALAPAAPAVADQHMPWDQQGSAWQGTLTTSIHRKYPWGSGASPTGEGSHTQDETANYSNLMRLDPTADGWYTGHLDASGIELYRSYCDFNDQEQVITRLQWSVDRDQSQEYSPYLVSLRTDNAGKTFFMPALVTVPMTYQNYCAPGGSGETSTTVLGFESGRSGETVEPLNDTDPDPLHLVGSTSWSLQNMPYVFGNGIPDEFTFTATYDLRLVEDNLAFEWSVNPRTRDSDSDGLIDTYVAGGAQSARLEPNQSVTVRLDACSSAPGAAVRWFVDSVALPENGLCHYSWHTPEGDYQVQAQAVVDGVTRGSIRLVDPVHHVVVGLGDSYGSGEGAPRRIAIPKVRKAVWDQETCHRSANSAQARAALKLEKSSDKSAVTFVHLACSGATVNRGILGTFKGQPTQIEDAFVRTSGNQIDAVVLSVGGNDIGFADVIMKCLVPFNNCPLRSVDNPDGAGEVNLHEATQMRLGKLYERYERVAACLTLRATECELGTVLNLGVSPEKVFHTEYPDLTRNDGGSYCASISGGFSRQELAWADQVVANGEAGSTFLFDGRLRTRELKVSEIGLSPRILSGDVLFGWSPVDGINEVSSNHGYCADNHWVVRIPESLLGQGDATGSFHPNNKGQKAYGKLIAEKLEAAL